MFLRISTTSHRRRIQRVNGHENSDSIHRGIQKATSWRKVSSCVCWEGRARSLAEDYVWELSFCCEFESLASGCSSLIDVLRYYLLLETRGSWTRIGTVFMDLDALAGVIACMSPHCLAHHQKAELLRCLASQLESNPWISRYLLKTQANIKKISILATRLWQSRQLWTVSP
jgi:hypothetical protein